jgi:hypothetical protein
VSFARAAPWVVVVVVGAGAGPVAQAAATRREQSTERGPRAPAAGARARGGSAPVAPSGPPLLAHGGSVSGAEGGPDTSEEREQTVPERAGDPLVSNGLGSPLCMGALGGAELTTSSRRHCETSGFVAAPAPTGNYGIDVHIDTGLLGISSGGLLSIVQDLFVTPLWMLLVWAVHSLVVMLEWALTIDLLDGPAGGGLARGLRQMQTAFTVPWLALALAVVSVTSAYAGLVRRRIGETVGEVLLTLGMMVMGLWVMADPLGTVGVVGAWANEASLGTLATTARGSPDAPGAALGQSLETVYAAAIEGPWCFLEFGDVAWCRDPARMDPRLRAAGLEIAARERAAGGCGPEKAGQARCAGGTHGGPGGRGAQLLTEARSNGAVFLAFQPNGPTRNSINDSWSLLRTICRSSEATNCHGPDAEQAEFRTNGGTWPRVGGLLLIAAGLLGMLLLLGFIAIRLLSAALFSLLFLLLAPGMVLAPAFGESGRAMFRRWAVALLGAVVAKLLFSFVLGVVLAVGAILANLTALGWWTQWLLTSAFWWGAFVRRHDAIGLAGDTVGREHRRPTGRLRRRLIGTLDPQRRAIDALGLAKARLVGRGSERVKAPAAIRASDDGGHVRIASGAGRAVADEQARRSAREEQRQAELARMASPRLRNAFEGDKLRLARLERERQRAQAAGDRRRALVLAERARRLQADVRRREKAMTGRTLDTNDARSRLRERLPGGERLGAHARFLDAQAALPDARARSTPAGRRDYAALAALLGIGALQYERLDPGRRRSVRLEVDRELARRREHRAGTADGSRRLTPAIPPAPTGTPPTAPASRHREVRPPESAVMHDLREVAARRKRQLGFDRD